MPRRVLAALAPWIAVPWLAALATGAAAATPAVEAEPALAARLAHALEARALTGARTGALVIARNDGAVLFAREPDWALVPASNQKVLTAIAALAAFGPTHRFETEILADAAIDAEGAVGTLWVRGGGDPALTSEDFWRLAADLRRLGLRRVKGDLALDDTAFDAERWHPSWGPVSPRAYHAPVGALNVNYGAFAAAVTPGAAQGEPVRVFVDPPAAYLEVVNRAVTGPARGRHGLQVDRRAGPGAELVAVSGSVPVGSPSQTVHRSVLDPTRYAGSVLRMQLESVGIPVGGQVRLGAVPASARRLYAFQGRPLAEIARLFVKYSNNAIAESLVKALGARASGAAGSWGNGIPAMRRELEALGLDTAGLILVDGSGLSYENRVTPRALVEALRIADDSFRFGPELVSALPIAGGDGTLQKRAESAAESARAKTGLLTRVTGLSGFARLADGREVVFSVLSNGYRGDATRAMDALDGFVAALVGNGP